MLILRFLNSLLKLTPKKLIFKFWVKRIGLKFNLFILCLKDILFLFASNWLVFFHFILYQHSIFRFLVRFIRIWKCFRIIFGSWNCYKFLCWINMYLSWNCYNSFYLLLFHWFFESEEIRVENLNKSSCYDLVTLFCLF